MSFETEQSKLRARVVRIQIEGFRSFQNIDVKLPRLTVMIGPNGAGKSNLVRFFEMLGWMLLGRNLGEFIEKYGGGDDQLFMGAKSTPRMNALVTIDSGQGLNEYRFGLAHVTARDRLMFVDEAFRFSRHGLGTQARWVELDAGGAEAAIVEVAGSQDTPANQRRTARMLVHLLRQCASYQFHDTSVTAPIKTAWDPSDHNRLRSHGGNLAAVLLYLREEHYKRYRLIERQISRVLPTFSGFELEPISGRIQLRWRGPYGDKTFGAHLTSDGSLRLFSLMTLLNLPPEMLPDVILIDEPELGLHPAAISLIAQMLDEVAEEHQVIVSTQSPFLVDCFDLENIVVADLDNGATRLRALNGKEYEKWLEDDYQISDLWQQNLIGGRP